MVQVCTLPEFLDQWRRITSNGFVLNNKEGHHLQLRYHPGLLHNFRRFNIKAMPALYSVTDELLAKGTIEPSSGEAGFHSQHIVVVCKHIDGLCPILNLKQFS